MENQIFCRKKEKFVISITFFQTILCDQHYKNIYKKIKNFFIIIKQKAKIEQILLSTKKNV